MIPVKLSSAPIGIWIGCVFACKRSLIVPTQYWKSAPTLSILFTNTSLGTPYVVGCRHTVSVCGSTPDCASSTVTALSSTRNERSTSTVIFFSSRRRHTISKRDWSSDVCSSDLLSHELRIFTNTTSKYNGIQSVKHGSITSYIFFYAISIHVQSQYAISVTFGCHDFY